MKTKKLPITIAILTKNEEMVIEDAILSVKKHFNEIVVLDSFRIGGNKIALGGNKIKI